MRVLFSVCGEGLGHATRCLAAAMELNQHEVAFVSYGKAKRLNGKFELGRSIRESIFNAKSSLPKILRSEIRIMREYTPDLVCGSRILKNKLENFVNSKNVEIISVAMDMESLLKKLLFYRLLWGSLYDNGSHLFW